MKPRLLGGITILVTATAMMGQSTNPAVFVPKPATFTGLNCTERPCELQLPGSLTLTATVLPPRATGGVPTGEVDFFNATTGRALGKGLLKPIPATQNFSAPANTANVGFSPFGLFTLPSGTSPNFVLGLLDWYLAGDPFYYPQVTIFGSKPIQIQNSGFFYPYVTLGKQIVGSIDSYAIGDFNHDLYPDVLLHGFNGTKNQYYLLPGKKGGGFDQTLGVISPDAAPISCGACDPLPTTITADDFNEDGYPDVAYAAHAPPFGEPNITNPIGVALNAGAGSKHTFEIFDSAPTLADGTKGDTFTPTALASGHFFSSGHADLVVAGYFVTQPVPGTAFGTRVLPGKVVLFPGNGDGTFGTPAMFSGSDGTIPTAVATAALRGNGMPTDVVLANAVATTSDASPAPTNTVQVFFGDGQGGLKTSSPITLPVAPASLTIADFNGDGSPDILVTGIDGSLNLIVNDGTGKLSTPTAIGTTPGIPSLTTSGDFNGDGLTDIAEITESPLNPKKTTSTASTLLNSAWSQAIFDTPQKTLPAGTDTLTATFPGDNNFDTSTSAGLDVTVTQTVPTIKWPTPRPIEYPNALSAMQLNAAASVPGSFVYSPAAGTVLPLGQTTDTAVFAPTDSFDYSGATAAQTITVIPPPVTATATAPETTETAQSDSASLTVNSYPLEITPTVTLSFTPAPPITVPDPAVLFPNNDTTQMLPTIPANSTTSLPIDFNTGSTAGTITLTTKLTLTNNPTIDVTPNTLTPVNISVPAAPPVITSVQLTRSGQTMTTAIVGLSSTRDMTQAHFHFTPAPGKDLKTTDLTVDLSPPFGTWYGSSDSDVHGTNFTYTQPFTLNSDATKVGSVAVTLTNSKGDSQASTAQ